MGKGEVPRGYRPTGEVLKNTGLPESGRTGAESTGGLGTLMVVAEGGKGKEVWGVLVWPGCVWVQG